MKYLLLGGAGFIGTHLTNRLMDEGHEVVIIDSLVTSKEPQRYTRFVCCDIRYLDIDPFVEDCDVVYFLAASVGVLHIDKNPKTTLHNNLELMQHVLPYLEKYNKRTIFASSSEVYGDGPFKEDNNLSIGPPPTLRWGYAAAKLTTEFMIAAGSFPYVIARFFNVVGPGQLPDYGMVLPRFVEAAADNEPLVVHGTGDQIRSFCHVADAVEYLRRIENHNNEIYNVGGEQPISIGQLAEEVIRCTGSQSNIVYVPHEEVFTKNTKDINYRVPDLTKLYAATDYKPKYTLEDIINESTVHIRSSR